MKRKKNSCRVLNKRWNCVKLSISENYTVTEALELVVELENTRGRTVP